MQLKRSTGDESPLRVTWSGDVRLDDVTGVSLEVYDDNSKTTLLETLTGEIRGFDPACWFPVLTPSWTGARFFQIGLHRGAEDKPLSTLHTWSQS